MNVSTKETGEYYCIVDVDPSVGVDVACNGHEYPEIVDEIVG